VWDVPWLTVGAFKSLLYILLSLVVLVIFSDRLIMPWSLKLVKTDFKKLLFNHLKALNR
jgi:hypothetical protein